MKKFTKEHIQNFRNQVEVSRERDNYPKKMSDCTTVDELKYHLKFIQFVNSLFICVSGLLGAVAFFGFNIFGQIVALIFVVNMGLSYLSFINYKKAME